MQAFYISQWKLPWPISITLLHPEGNQLSFPSNSEITFETTILWIKFLVLNFNARPTTVSTKCKQCAYEYDGASLTIFHCITCSSFVQTCFYIWTSCNTHTSEVTQLIRTDQLNAWMRSFHDYKTTPPPFPLCPCACRVRGVISKWTPCLGNNTDVL